MVGGFRRDAEKSLAWSRWLHANRDRLIEWGVPADVWSDERRWGYFVEHSYDPVGGWKPSMLDEPERAALRDFMREQYGERAAAF
jgi:hypothetical protein